MASEKLDIVVHLKDKASKELSGLKRAFNNSYEDIIRTAKRAAVAIGVAATAIAAVSIKLASDAEETQSKFNTVFSGMEVDMNMWAEQFSTDVGRARQDIKAFSAGIADVLKPMGLQTNAAAEMSQQMVELALDVASFNNRQDADVIHAFTSALTGERESLKTLGIVINEADVKQEAYRAGLVEVGAELTKEAKAQATVNLLFANSKDAQGDLERTSGSFANQTKKLTSTLKNLGEDIGKVLLPNATKLITSFSETIDEMGGTEEIAKRLQPALEQLTDAFMGAADQLLSLSTDALPKAIGMFENLVRAITPVSDALMFLFNAADSVIGLFKHDFPVVAEKMGETTQTFVDGTLKMETYVKASNKVGLSTEEAATRINDYSEAFGGLEAAGAALNMSLDEMNKILGNTVDDTEEFVNTVSGGGGSASQSVKDFTSDIDDLIEGFEEMQEKGSEKALELALDFETAMTDIDNAISDIDKSLADLQERFASETKSQSEDFASAVVESEEKVADLQAEIAEKKAALAEETDEDKIASGQAYIDELQTQLDKELEAREALKDQILAHEEEISEVKRFNGLTELEQAYEKFQEERQASIDTFEEEKLLLEDKRLAYEQSKKDLIALADEMWIEIGGLQNKANITYGAFLNSREEITQGFVDKTKAQLEELEAMFNKIDSLQSFSDGSMVQGFADGGVVYAQDGYRAKGTDTVPAMLTPGEVVLSAAQQKNIAGRLGGGNIIINNPVVLKPSDIVDMIGDPLIKEFSKHSAFA